MFLVVLVVAPAAMADTIRFTVDTPPSALRVGARGVRLATHDAAVLREPGEPALPWRIVPVALPPGHRIASVRVKAFEVAPLDGVTIPASPAPVSARGETGGGDGIVRRSPDGRAFPQRWGRALGGGVMRGFALAGVAVFPVREVDGRFVRAGRLDVVVETEPDPAASRTVRRLRRRPAVERADRERVAAMVVNPRAVERYPVAAAPSAPSRPGLRPTAYPSLEGSPVDCVIVTNDSLAAAWQRLADWRTAEGIPTVVRTTEWIRASYRNGVDLAETIRNFVIDAYAKWGIQYLLLGGDTDQVPVRFGATQYLQNKHVPVDMYYACLDGDWNADHDDLFGEPGPSADAPDLYAEVWVGRLPAASVSDVNVFTDKIVSYESAVHRDYLNRVLMAAEVLFPIDWNPPDPVALDGASIADFVDQLAFRSDPNLDVVHMYENDTAWPGAIPESAPAAIDSINVGFNHMDHVGHGFRFNMSMGTGNILNGDADAFTNTDRYTNLYLLNCTAVAYTYNCLAEHWLRNPVGGAVSVIGANESAFPVASQPYMNDYYFQSFVQGLDRIGQAFDKSRLSRTPVAVLGDNVDLWTHYIYTLLADPAQRLYTTTVDTLVVSHVDTVSPGTPTISVHVEDSGGPLPGATVCLSRDDQDYRVLTTDGAGDVATPFTVETPGSVSVVVTARNRVRHQSWIVVTDGGAYLRTAGVTVDDDSTGASLGNGDGVIDAGERVELWVDVNNAGSTSSGAVTLRLRSVSTFVTIVDSISGTPALAPGATTTSTSPFVVDFGSFAPDERVTEFTVVAEYGGVELWSDTFRKLIHAPALEVDHVRVDDSVGGNGDGVVQPGEPVDLYVTWKNFGTGAAVGLTGSLADVTGGFVFTDSVSVWPDLAAVASGENVTPLRLVEPDTSGVHTMRLTLTDAFGRTWTHDIELRAPAPPDSLVFDPSLGPDRLHITWKASPSPDVQAYVVYRAPDAAGPFTRVSVDPVRHTVFLDDGLQSTTRYWYRVTAVDASGNESAPSTVWPGSTNPAQVEGWPITMAVETVSSPVVGDIDGDQDFEIVQGDDYLYAWHANGVEVRDADGNAQTWGLFSLQGSSFVSPPALAELDSVPGAEIVAASRDTREIFVFNAQGQVLPGWPRPVENAIRAGLVTSDVDGDGVPEIIAIDELGVLYVFHADGTELRDGDADPATTGVFRRFGGCTYQYGTPATGDFDGDGLREIVVGTQGDTLFVFNADGTLVPGWPQALSADVAGSPAVGDVDGDGTLDVVASQWDGWIRAWRADGTTIWSQWVRNYIAFAPSPALGDLTGDGFLETVIPASDGRVFVFTHTGGYAPGWPVVYTTSSWTESSPVIADIDRDGLLDVVLGDETRFIHGWNALGQELDGFPLAAGDAVRATPTIADVDKDGDVDLIVASWDKSVYVWDFPAMFDPHAAPWASFHANLYNDGNVATPLPTPVLQASFGWRPLEGGVEITWQVPGQAGRTFDVSRRRLDDDHSGAWTDLARGVRADAEGVVRWTDRGARPGERYVYRLAVSGDAASSLESRPVYVPVRRAALEANVPNPFNPDTRIAFQVPDGAPRRVRLVVYDVRGARVRTLVDRVQRGGRFEARWDGRDDRGRRVASGVYFYRLELAGFAATRKMVLLK